MTSRIELQPADFDALARGGCENEMLLAGQLDRRIGLVKAIVEAAESFQPALSVAADLTGGLAVLGRARAAARARVDELLLHPQVGGWSMRCLRLLVRPTDDIPSGSVTGAAGLAAHLGYLGSLAAAAAAVAGHECDVTAHAIGGLLVLPTLGALRVDSDVTWIRVALRVTPGPSRGCLGTMTSPAMRPEVRSVRISLGQTEHALTEVHIETVTSDAADDSAEARVPPHGWIPLRRLRAGPKASPLTVDLDDIDPFRRANRLAGQLAPTTPLPATEVAQWQRRLDGAWRQLVNHHPKRADVIRATVRSLIPLNPAPTAGQVESLSASSADAFGAVALTFPDDELAMAATLIHEVAHSQLSALIDLYPLLRPDARKIFYSPWRRDPRPLSGLLQGAFAFLMLTAFWGDHRLVDAGPGGRLAAFEYARHRAQVSHALDELERSGGLAPPGRRFVAGMRAWLADLAPGPGRAPVRDDHRRLAAAAVDDHRIRWRFANVQPPPDVVDRLAAAWSRGERAPDLPGGGARVAAAPGPRFVADGRLRLTLQRVMEPSVFARLAETPHRLLSEVPGIQLGDALWAVGDRDGAARAYRATVERSADDIDAWAGLAMCRPSRSAAGRRLIGDPFATQPELVRALHARLSAGGPAPDPNLLADWLAR